jgi:DNA polymerase/3'-5' exonuclease PolX
MNLLTAKHYAEKLYGWVLPYCEPVTTGPTLQVAGSIRRERPVCNDIDLVCIPKVQEQRDLLGVVISRVNLLHRFLQDYVAGTNGKSQFQSGGEREGKSVIIQTSKCQIDIWFATPATWATRLLCRTGSMDHNIWLASRAKSQNKKWTPYEGILAGGQWRRVVDTDEYIGGQLLQLDTEEKYYRELDLPYIEPRDRELPWLVKNFGADQTTKV